MAILADTIDGVIGVDTHRDTLAAAALTPVGGILAQTATGADAAGYQQLLAFADSHVAGDRARRCWAVEGAGSYGAGPGRVPARPRRAGRRGRPAQAPRPPHRRQDRRDRCGPCRSTGTQPRSAAPGAAAPPRRPRSAAGAARGLDGTSAATGLLPSTSSRRSSSARPRSCAPSCAAWRPPHRSAAVRGYGTGQPSHWNTA
jgi:hypothetical protein